MLTIEPKGGLCNRMRAIDSAVALARDIDHPLKLIWNRDKACGAKFHDIFEPITDVVVFEERNKLSKTHAARRSLRRLLRQPACAANFPQQTVRALVNGRFDFRYLAHHDHLHFWTYDRFYTSTEPFSAFVLKPEIRGAVDQAAARFAGAIGVHIRRGDNVHAIEISKTDLFVDKLKQLLPEHPRSEIFVATDDPDEVMRLRSEFPDRVVSRGTMLRDRSTTGAIRDAVIDLYCLSHTKCILGTVNSSFCQTAATIGGIPLHIMRED